MLDDFYSDYEETLNSQLDDIDALVEELILSVNGNASDILSTLKDATSEVGIGLSQEIKDIWENSGSAWNAISSNTDKVTERVSSVLEVVRAIYKNTCLISGENETLSFASGGLVDYTGMANVHGSKSKPELMLNANDTQNFLKLRDALRNADIPTVQHTIGIDYSKLATKIITAPNTPNETNYSNCGNTVIEIDHVQDYNDFVRQMQHDDKFERMIQDMTIGRAMGGNPFNKYLHKWK